MNLVARSWKREVIWYAVLVMTKVRYALSLVLVALLLAGVVYLLGKNIMAVPPSSNPVQLGSVYKVVMTTQFWVGEEADESNGYIRNDDSYWDEEWVEHYGGVDLPSCRAGFYPCGFTPKENPFYWSL